jgi:hypothetical protein
MGEDGKGVGADLHGLVVEPGVHLRGPRLNLIREPCKNNSLNIHRNTSVSDPDWIQIRLGQRIWIRIGNPDPDPGRPKLFEELEPPFKGYKKTYTVP